MRKIKVAISGLPGKVSWPIASAIANSKDLELFPLGLTGPEITLKHIVVSGVPVKLLTPDERHLFLDEGRPDLIIDFTHPSAIKDNVDFYARIRIPFVLGTTGGDADYVVQAIKEAAINAVMAPNMAKEIVAFQMMMDYLADSFPGLFKEYNLNIVESHQQGKADTSGTAKHMVKIFNKLGIHFLDSYIIKKRTEADYEAMGIPQEYWGGHGWHTYALDKKDGSVAFRFTHNVNGREAYVSGTLDAARYLFRKEQEQGNVGHLYSMADVLRND